MISFNGMTLSDDLLWTDEFAWSASQFLAKKTLGGNVSILKQKVRGNSGRPMTLAADFAWMQRSTVLALQKVFDALEGPGNIVLHDGREFSVIPANQGFLAEQLDQNPEPGDGTYYKISLSFIITA